MKYGICGDFFFFFDKASVGNNFFKKLGNAYEGVCWVDVVRGEMCHLI